MPYYSEESPPPSGHRKAKKWLECGLPVWLSFSQPPTFWVSAGIGCLGSHAGGSVETCLKGRKVTADLTLGVSSSAPRAAPFIRVPVLRYQSVLYPPTLFCSYPSCYLSRIPSSSSIFWGFAWVNRFTRLTHTTQVHHSHHYEGPLLIGSAVAGGCLAGYRRHHSQRCCTSGHLVTCKGGARLIHGHLQEACFQEGSYSSPPLGPRPSR